jgi:sigma54-dependent transcription regulator
MLFDACARRTFMGQEGAILNVCSSGFSLSEFGFAIPHVSRTDPRRCNNIQALRTYSQLYVYVIFAVEGRQNLIAPAHKQELQKYMTGIVTNKGQS